MHADAFVQLFPEPTHPYAAYPLALPLCPNVSCDQCLQHECTASDCSDIILIRVCSDYAVPVGC